MASPRLGVVRESMLTNPRIFRVNNTHCSVIIHGVLVSIIGMVLGFAYKKGPQEESPGS